MIRPSKLLEAPPTDGEARIADLAGLDVASVELLVQAGLEEDFVQKLQVHSSSTRRLSLPAVGRSDLARLSTLSATTDR